MVQTFHHPVLKKFEFQKRVNKEANPRYITGKSSFLGVIVFGNKMFNE
jgi:hypothetical protein